VSEDTPMNTDDRALADLKAAVVREVISMYNTTRLAGTDPVVHVMSKSTVRQAFDRLEAFHAKPGRDDIERDVRIAIWNAAMKGGMGQDLSQAFIVRAMAEPMMVRALAGLQSPPPVVSGEAKRPSHLSVIPVKGHPEKHAVYDAIMGDAIAVCPDEIAAQMVFDALTKADTPPVVEEGRREALVRTIADYQHKRGLTWEEACEDANGIADAILALTPVSGVGDVTRHLEALADNNPDKPADWLSGVMDAISAIRALSTPVAAQGDVREALKPYTQHLVGCRMRLRQGASECTCGLTSALAILGSPHEVSLSSQPKPGGFQDA